MYDAIAVGNASSAPLSAELDDAQARLAERISEIYARLVQLRDRLIYTADSPATSPKEKLPLPTGIIERHLQALREMDNGAKIICDELDKLQTRIG